MLAEPMSQTVAQEIAHEIVKGRKKFGAQFSAPYPSYQIQEALCVLFEQTQSLATAWEERVPKEELTLANRRLGACEARVAKLSKKNEKNPDEG
jgi:hypothetical protein